MEGGEKSIGKELLLVGFLSYLDSHTYQTQAVFLEKMDLLSPQFMVSYEITDRLTDLHTDGRTYTLTDGLTHRLTDLHTD